MGINTSDIGDILKALEIIAIFGTGAVVVFKVGRTMEKFESLGSRQTEKIEEMKTTIDRLAEVQIKQISDRALLNSHATLISEMRREINMLRMGRGFIKSEIDKEYP
jgi:hypothetical protein